LELVLIAQIINTLVIMLVDVYFVVLDLNLLLVMTDVVLVPKASLILEMVFAKLVLWALTH